MADVLKLDILTPQGRLQMGEGTSEALEVAGVEVPGVLGELGILPRHIPFISPVVPGVVRFKAEGKDVRVAVGKGFVEVHGDTVSILTNRVVKSEDVKSDEVKTELAEVKTQLQSMKDSIERPEHVQLAEKEAWLEAQLRAAAN